MKTFTALAVLLSATLALALPSSTPRSSPQTSWQVANFVEGCSPGGCTYSFSVSWDLNLAEPAFVTHCSGTDVQNKLVPCDPYPNQQISSNAVPVRGGELTVVVQHSWSEGEATYWIEGNATISSAATGKFPRVFTVKQSSEYATAK